MLFNVILIQNAKKYSYITKYYVIYVNIACYNTLISYNDIKEVEFLHNIGEKIKKIRIKKGMKQYELAQKSGISNTYLSDLEVGRTTPSIKTLDKLSKALEVDIKIFL